MTLSTTSDAEIIAALRVHHTVTATAEALGMATSTIYDRRRKSPDVAQAILEAREWLVDKAEHALEDLIEAHDFRAINLTLRTLGRERGYVERVESLDLSDEKLEAELARERAKRVVAPDPVLLPFPRPVSEETKE